ncbi:hypothetical protein HDU92_007939 [Lobulomyces angularis]|nr:hypothetical protein HDU92_007939 [Lobulomyces angularis]
MKRKDTNGIIKFCESGQSGRGVCMGDVPKSTRGKQMSLSTTAKGFCYLYGKNKSYCKCTDHKGWYDSRNLQDFYTFTCYDNGKECRSENCS